METLTLRPIWSPWCHNAVDAAFSMAFADKDWREAINLARRKTMLG